ncbi:MAG: hypothetical protein ACLR6O_05255 [Eubacterium sp.]
MSTIQTFYFAHCEASRASTPNAPVIMAFVPNIVNAIISAICAAIKSQKRQSEIAVNSALEIKAVNNNIEVAAIVAAKTTRQVIKYAFRAATRMSKHGRIDKKSQNKIARKQVAIILIDGNPFAKQALNESLLSDLLTQSPPGISELPRFCPSHRDRKGGT